MPEQPSDYRLIDVLTAETRCCPITRCLRANPNDLRPVRSLCPLCSLCVVSPGKDQALALLVELLLLEDRQKVGVNRDGPDPPVVLQRACVVTPEVDDLLLQVDVFPPQAC